MASRTQLRLGQITGSFGTSSINDQIAAAATGSIATTDLQGVLSHLAGAIKRIHGSDSFSEASAGVFNQNLQIAGTTPKLTIGDAGAEDTLLVYDGNAQDYYVGLDDSDDSFKIGLGSTIGDGSGAALTINTSANATFAGDATVSGRVIVDDTTNATSTTDGSLQTDGGLSVALDAVIGDDLFLLSDDAVLNFGAGNDVTFTHDGAATSGMDVASAGAFDITAGAASVIKTTAGDLTIDSDAARVILTGSSGADSVLVQSDATFSADVIITGDLTINGSTTTVSTTNMLVEDSLIGLNDGASSNTNDLGFIFERGSTGDNAVFIWDESEDKFTLGTTAATPDATGNLTITAGDLVINDLSAAGLTSSDLTDNRVVIAGSSGVLEDDANLTFDGSDLQLANNIGLVLSTDDAEKIESDGTDLTINSGGDINLTATSDVNLPSNVGLTFGNDAEKIEANGTRLSIASGDGMILDCEGDIILDADGADIFFDDAGTRFGGINMNAGASYLILSSSAGNNVALASQGGQVFIGDKDFSGLTVAADQPNELQFLDRDDRLRINLESSAGNDQILLSGSVFLDNGAAAAQLVFEEAAANGSNTITLDIPAAVGSSYTLTLPAANGSSGQVLKLSDANGNLEFGDATGDLARFVYKATAAVAAGNVDFGGSKTAGISALAVGTADLNITKSDAELNNALEVYVNGQLLVSGSDGGADTDYTFIDADTLKFAFGLEADDIIQIIQR